MSEDGLRIRLLGDVQLQLHGRPLELPPSKKTRALLAYLVATGRPQLRERHRAARDTTEGSTVAGQCCCR